MIIGVMSDTHGNCGMMHCAAEHMTEEIKVDLIFHLGDDYGDGEELSLCGVETRIIPGLWCGEYQDPSVPNMLVETFSGVTLSCAHAEQDLTGRERGADIVMTGHTHVAKIAQSGDVINLNPGHLKSSFDRGQNPSYAVIHIEEDGIEIAVNELNGDVRLKKHFAR